MGGAWRVPRKANGKDACARSEATASGRSVHPSPVLPPAGILFDEKNKLTNV